MPGSTFSTLQADHFDGESKLSRGSGTNAAKDLYSLLKELAHQTVTLPKDAADGAAGTATAERAFHRADTYTERVSAVKFVPGAALTADNTNYATLVVRKRKVDGSDGGVVAQATTQITGSGNWTAHVAVDLPLTSSSPGSSQPDLAAGESLTFEITKTAGGVVVPVGVLVAHYD